MQFTPGKRLNTSEKLTNFVSFIKKLTSIFIIFHSLYRILSSDEKKEKKE